MVTFKYGWLAKFVYRYANIPATLLLLVQSVSAVVMLTTEGWIYAFPLAIYIVLGYALNRFYIKVYKIFPFQIRIDNERMICSNFMNPKKVVEFKLDEIEEITGGIFSGNAARPLYLRKGNEKIGIFNHLKNYNKLLTVILSNVNQPLYQSLLAKMEEQKVIKKDEIAEKIKKRKGSAKKQKARK